MNLIYDDKFTTATATTIAFAGVSIGGLVNQLPGSAGGDLSRDQGHFLAALGAARVLVLSRATALSQNFHRGKREQGWLIVLDTEESHLVGNRKREMFFLTL